MVTKFIAIEMDRVRPRRALRRVLLCYHLLSFLELEQFSILAEFLSGKFKTLSKCNPCRLNELHS